MIWIRSGRDKPDNAFVSIPYWGHWYWIENRDYRSKQIFSFPQDPFSSLEQAQVDLFPLG